MARPHRRALAFLGFWVRQAPHDTPRIGAVVDQPARRNRVAPSAGYTAEKFMRSAGASPIPRAFGPSRAVPLGSQRQGLAYARAWGARHKQPRQHKGPITRAFLEVLEALLWGFHNSRSGCCFPSYAAIAAKAECARSTVAEALKALEWAGVLHWQNRITRIHIRERDLFGRWASRWRVIRTSNAYVFCDPQQHPEGVPASKSENPPGTQNQEILDSCTGTTHRPGQPIRARLATPRWRHQGKIAHEQGRQAGSCHLTSTAEEDGSCRDRSTGGSRAGKLWLIRGAARRGSYRGRRKMSFGIGSSMATPGRSTRSTRIARSAAPATCLI